MNKITLTLSKQEIEVVESLCKKLELSPEQLLRQALRVYQYVTENADKNREMFGCPSPE